MAGGWMRRHKIATGLLVLLAVGAVGSAFEDTETGGTAQAAIMGGAPAQEQPAPPAATPTATAIPTPTSAATRTPSPEATPTPVVETRTETETRSIDFDRTTVRDATLAKGREVVTTRGAAGQETLTYEVTFTDGVQTAKTLIRRTVTVEPVDQVTKVGTKVAAPKPKPAPKPACHDSYAGACVPIAYDVDCAGGSGNGPEYVAGPVRVVGYDEYDLDSDNDGFACES